jgi:ubiquinone/menaquinone biosynthesis C-methylase UbiE
MTNKKTSSILMLDPRRQKRDVMNPEEILREVGIEGNMKFADLGCGAGYFAIPAARMVGKYGKVYAVDILKSELADVAIKAKMDGLLNVQTVWADLEVPKSTKIAADSIDMVLLSHVFYQSDKHPQVLEEAKRIIKNSGRIIVLEWEKTDSPIGPPKANRVDRQDLLAKAQAVGLELVSDFKAGSYHYGLILSKAATSDKAK